MDSEDFKLIEVKYSELRIDQMQEFEIRTKTAECLRKIHIITGWNLPDDMDYVKDLIEQFYLKLKEDFFMLNFSEIAFAFRKNGLGIKDWGKNMNLDLVCTVLGVYASERHRISSEEEKLNHKPVQVTYTDEQLDNKSRGEIETAFQVMRGGRVPLVFDYWLEVLQKDGLSKDETLGEFFVRLLNNQVQNIYQKG